MISLADNSTTIVQFKYLSKTRQKEIITKIRNMITNKKTRFEINHPKFDLFISLNPKKYNWMDITSSTNSVFGKMITLAKLNRKNSIKNKHQYDAGNGSKFDRVIFTRLPHEIELLLAVVNRKSFDEYRTFLGLSPIEEEN